MAPPQLPGPARWLGAGAGLGLGRGWLELCEWLLSGELDWSWGDGGDEISDIDLVQTVCGGAYWLYAAAEECQNTKMMDSFLSFVPIMTTASRYKCGDRERDSIVSIVSCPAAAGMESKVSLILGGFYIFTLFG